MDAKEDELQHLQNKLQQTNKKLDTARAEFEEFVYIVSHDLQAPLRQIAGFLDLIAAKDHSAFDEEMREYLHYLRLSGHKLSTLIESLLQYSRVTTRANAKIALDCTALLEHVLKSLAATIEQRNAIIHYNNLPNAVGEPAQISYVFQALIDNALKFNCNPQPKIEISGIEDEQQWLFSVCDNGIGIDPNQCTAIFNLFRRLHPENEFPGIGAGLAISKRIIEQHNGLIWAESRAEQGCCIKFKLPKTG